MPEYEATIALDPYAHRWQDQVGEARRMLAAQLEANGADITQIRFVVEDNFERNVKIMRAFAPERAYSKTASIVTSIGIPPDWAPDWAPYTPKPVTFLSLIADLDVQRHALMPAQAAKTEGLKPAQLRMVIKYLEAVLGAMKS